MGDEQPWTKVSTDGLPETIRAAVTEVNAYFAELEGARVLHIREADGPLPQLP
jgi:hypothetical protein